MKNMPDYTGCRSLIIKYRQTHIRRLLVMIVLLILNIYGNVVYWTTKYAGPSIAQAKAFDTGVSMLPYAMGIAAVILSITCLVIGIFADQRRTKLLILLILLFVAGWMADFLRWFIAIPLVVMYLFQFPECRKMKWLTEQPGYPYFNERFEEQQNLFGKDYQSLHKIDNRVDAEMADAEGAQDAKFYTKKAPASELPTLPPTETTAMTAAKPASRPDPVLTEEITLSDTVWHEPEKKTEPMQADSNGHSDELSDVVPDYVPPEQETFHEPEAPQVSAYQPKQRKKIDTSGFDKCLNIQKHLSRAQTFRWGFTAIMVAVNAVSWFASMFFVSIPTSSHPDIDGMLSDEFSTMIFMLASVVMGVFLLIMAGASVHSKKAYWFTLGTIAIGGLMGVFFWMMAVIMGGLYLTQLIDYKQMQWLSEQPGYPYFNEQLEENRSYGSYHSSHKLYTGTSSDMADMMDTVPEQKQSEGFDAELAIRRMRQNKESEAQRLMEISRMQERFTIHDEEQSGEMPGISLTDDELPEERLSSGTSVLPTAPIPDTADALIPEDDFMQNAPDTSIILSNFPEINTDIPDLPEIPDIPKI